MERPATSRWKRPILISVLCGTYLTMWAEPSTQLETSRMEAKTFVVAGAPTNKLRYLLYLPKAYQTSPGTVWPLMLFLHGAGERGSNVFSVSWNGPPKLVREGHDLPFILVSPQCPEKQWWYEYDKTLIKLLDDIETQYRVDTNRVYLTGLSMGGSGTWSVGLKHPDRFAALAPICGAAKIPSLKNASTKNV